LTTVAGADEPFGGRGPGGAAWTTVAGMAEPATDHRQATAQRNVEAILDACEALAARGAALTIAALAAESGVSRVTVYAHFDSIAAVLQAASHRAVQRVMAAVAEVDVEAGSGLEALGRVVGAVWPLVGEMDGLSRATGDLLAPEARRSAHGEVFALVDGLIARGRGDGSIRDDVPPAWQSSVIYALIHTAVDDINHGRIDAADAEAALAGTVRAALRG
jgi:AcrR family transcriptional regulator